jgi:hypothetical protein
VTVGYTLAQLEQAIRDGWDRDTVEDDTRWTPDNPSCGQCDVTCMVVHDLLGGDILAAGVFLDGEHVENHMWNRLSSGIDVDLTREQFKRGEVLGEPTVRRRPVEFPLDHPRYHRYEAYLVLSGRVRASLGLDG